MKEKSVEELLGILGGEDTKEEDSIVSFVKYYHLTHGEELVKLSFLYELYVQYTIEPKSKEEFKKELDKHFLGQRGFIKLSIKSLDLSERAKSLIKVEKKKSQLESKRYINNYNCFIEYFDIQKGSYWIHLKNLYIIYLMWRRDCKIVLKLKYNDFVTLFKNNYEHKNNNIQVNEFITKDKIDEYKRRYEKKKQKIISKVSQP